MVTFTYTQNGQTLREVASFTNRADAAAKARRCGKFLKNVKVVPVSMADYPTLPDVSPKNTKPVKVMAKVLNSETHEILETGSFSSMGYEALSKKYAPVSILIETFVA